MYGIHQLMQRHDTKHEEVVLAKEPAGKGIGDVVPENRAGHEKKQQRHAREGRATVRALALEQLGGRVSPAGRHYKTSVSRRTSAFVTLAELLAHEAAQFSELLRISLGQDVDERCAYGIGSETQDPLGDMPGCHLQELVAADRG